MKLHTFIWLLATCFYAAQALPTGKYRGESITIKGTVIERESPNSNAKLYIVTEARGVPEGRYLAKKGLGEHERHVSLASGIAIAANEDTKPKDQQCLLLKFVGKDVRTLPSYQTVHDNRARCNAWVQARLQVVQAAVTAFRQKAGDYAHNDLCAENTRWEDDNTVHIIDYGRACRPSPVPGGDQVVQQYTIPWENDLCEATHRRPAPADPNVPTINGGECRQQ
ncbi:hypothetical protein FRC17_007982 [Serendipita sp. 399]|nr:hypothetical protein FRC17_007982 [Serendipita sp. 399]